MFRWPWRKKTLDTSWRWHEIRLTASQAKWLTEYLGRPITPEMRAAAEERRRQDREIVSKFVKFEDIRRPVVGADTKGNE